MGGSLQYKLKVINIILSSSSSCFSSGLPQMPPQLEPPGADGAPGQPPGPPNTSSNRRLQQSQAQVEEVSRSRPVEDSGPEIWVYMTHVIAKAAAESRQRLDSETSVRTYTEAEITKHVKGFVAALMLYGKVWPSWSITASSVICKWIAATY